MSYYRHRACPVVHPHNCVDLFFTEPEVRSPCLGQEKAASEHSIPLGKHNNLKFATADEFSYTPCCHVALSES